MAVAREHKQIFIAVIFFIIIGLIGWRAFRFFVPATPPPTPNPTSNLAPVRVLASSLLHIASGDYDFVAKVQNPNTEYGARQVSYQLIFYRADKTEISRQTGAFYILPGQVKYVIDSPITLKELATNAEMRIRSIDWQKLNPLASDAARLAILNAPQFQPSQEPGVFGQVSGSLMNNSDLDINTVDVVVVLTDSNDQPIAVNKTRLETFLAKTTRGFQVSWFRPFAGAVGHVYIEANGNVLDNMNFRRTYSDGQEPFQQLY